MKSEFDVTLTVEDMYRFSMYHTYSGVHGIASVIIAVLVFFVAAKTYGDVELMYTLLYILFGVLFLVYMPFSLYLRAKRQIASSEVFQKPLHFTVTEEKITSSQSGETADLPWEQIYKVVETKSNILVYSSRINALVLPKNQIAGEYDAFRKIMEEKLPGYRLKLKK